MIWFSFEYIFDNKNSAQCTVEGRDFNKTQKWKNFKVWKYPKTFPKYSNTNWAYLEYFFGGQSSAQCTLEGRDLKKFKKNRKNLSFSKMSKNVPRSVQTCFEVTFSKIFGQCTLEIEIREKIRKKNRKNFELSKLSNNVLKSVQTCFELVLRWCFWKKNAQCTLKVQIWKNSKKIDKISVFQKCPKTFPRVFKHLTRWFFWNHHALQGRKMGKNEEKIEVLKFQNCPKTFLKVSKQVLNLFWGNFLGKKVPSAPRTVETWKNFKKLEKLSHFQNAQKRSQKQSNMFWTWFEEICSVKLLLSAPWRFERREDGKYGNLQYF